MPKKKTHEEFVEEISIKQPDIEVLGHYNLAMEKIHVRHKTCGYEWDVLPASLSRGIGCPKCGNSLRKSHQQFVNEIKIINPKIDIISKYISNTRKVKCKCKIDGHEWDVTPINLIKGNGCPRCSGKTVIQGVNDLATVYPQIANLLLYPEEAVEFHANSHKSTYFKCPDCGNVLNKIIHNVVFQGLSCPKCKDNITFPNKYLRYFIFQLPVDHYTFEQKFDWSNGFIYDAFFVYKNQKYVVEMDGGFHFLENRISAATVKLKDVQNRDREKERLANEHDIILIRINCLYSKSDYIEKNIKDSLFNKLFDLSLVDFQQISIDVTKNYIRMFCNYYENHKVSETIAEISKKFGITLNTFIQYYQKGIEFNWCK